MWVLEVENEVGSLPRQDGQAPNKPVDDDGGVGSDDAAVGVCSGAIGVDSGAVDVGSGDYWC